MIIPDINLLLYAHDSSSPFHARAAGRWQSSLSGTEPVGLLHVVVFGFVRIATNARAFLNPMTPAEAAGHVRSWLEQPPVQVLEPGPDHLGHVLKLLEGLGTAGNLASDAQMAELANDEDRLREPSGGGRRRSAQGGSSWWAVRTRRPIVRALAAHARGPDR